MVKPAAGYRPLAYSSPEAVQTTGTVANQPRMSIDLKAAKAHHRAGRSLHGGTGLRHQNRRRAHVVTRTSDDHGRYRHLVACQISQKSTTEVAVAHIGPQRPVQRTALFSVKYT